jgi:hypothetical protein
MQGAWHSKLKGIHMSELVDFFLGAAVVALLVAAILYTSQYF